MCMLTAIKLKEPQFARLLLTTLLQNNALAGNTDGVGIWYEDEYIKNKESSFSIPTLGQTVYNMFPETAENYMGHVRAASTGIAVTDENAHPFISKECEFLLAHNGKLRANIVPKWLSAQKVHGTSDSYIFVRALEETLKKQGKERKIVSALQTTMELFTGKFAFLIYDTKEDIFYAVRGKTAPLFIASQENGDGYVINTSKTTLEDSVRLAATSYESIFGRSDNLPVFSTPLLLDPEKIYRLGDEFPEVVGEITENIYVHPTTSTTFYRNNTQTHSTRNKGIVRTTEEILIDRVTTFMEDHLLSPQDIDVIFQMLAFTPLSETTTETLHFFCEDIIQRISAPKNLRKYVGKHFPYGIPLELYRKQDLEWPWMLNKPLVIKNVIEASNLVVKK